MHWILVAAVIIIPQWLSPLIFFFFVRWFNKRFDQQEQKQYDAAKENYQIAFREADRVKTHYEKEILRLEEQKHMLQLKSKESN